MAVDADSAQRARCANCGKWMLVRGGERRCAACAAAFKTVPGAEPDDTVDPHDQSQCGQCGEYIYFDAPRCPKCGAYNHAELEPAPRKVPRIFVIAAWLVIVAMLWETAYALYRLMRR